VRGATQEQKSPKIAKGPQIPPMSPIDGPKMAAVMMTNAGRNRQSKVRVRHRRNYRSAYALARSAQAACGTCPAATAFTRCTRAK
jgi:hypothetical protein